ncbi:MAG: Modification methylase HaeIII [Pelotomaculum sp. PtaB.Bin013]|uniref:Cytosine-specific methyltransferase n=1 Tax=Pelotomaculum isophthalicicum JI TaxID=947010 RepID=A0A9X4H130_9FIRM|nr:DNA cytosine methyltransferase [Pelotomaculum isophthalicicum]MDF9407740.1 DNA cytosine methyltransferase [Pelotomaculum isophthalicicum JI]OPX90758.1 MAG: Modification methylase HaeIII [Pelotomaculum sp. PtaB.Bin013]
MVRCLTNRILKKKPTVLSMFSGCGGLDLGFVQAGFDIVWANDINPDACLTYRQNIGKINEGDIFTFNIPEIDGLDVLTAGFPCQPFSNAGKRLGVNDSRGRLFEVCLRYVDVLRPKIVMFENVRGLLTIRNQNGVRLIEDICSSLTDSGYEVHFKLVNAASYGVPQNRLRIIIVAVAKNFKERDFRFPSPVIGADLTLGSCLNVSPETPNQNDLLKLNPQAVYLGSLVPEGGSWKDIPYDLLPDRLKRIRDNMRKYRWPNFYRRFARNEVAGTVTAAFKPENAGVWHPIEDRVLSAREIARIQSFPDTFVFRGSSVKAIYEMIGNAVAPRLAKAFADMFLHILEGRQEMIGAPLIQYSKLNLNKKPIRPGDPEILFDYPPEKRNVKELIRYENLELNFEVVGEA